MEESQLVTYIVTGVAIAVFITLFVLYLSVSERKRYLTQQNRIEKMEAEKKQEVLKAVIRTVESERMRIARDLHDSVGASLSMIKLEMSARAHLLGAGGEDAETHGDVLERIDDVVTAIRAACFQLYPTSLSQYGLNAMLEQTVIRWKDSVGIKTSFKSEIPEQRFPEGDFRLNLFRVFEEVMNNIVKHGKCLSVNVRLAPGPGETFSITISHDGLPFDNRQALASLGTGIGLTSIASRLDLIKGSIQYSSGKEAQSVVINAPLANV